MSLLEHRKSRGSIFQESTVDLLLEVFQVTTDCMNSLC